MLKLDLKTRSLPSERPDKETCGICKRQVSRYTCPSCNIPYCSLTCYRSEVHADCSENFYRKEIESDIQSAPSKSAGERNKMTELLRKFEEESTADFELDEIFKEDDGGLARKLEGLDLDKTDATVLWRLLSPSQRDSFLKAMRDPSSDLAQQLLSSSEFTMEHRRPWWESSTLSSDDFVEDKEFGVLPTMLTIPQGLSVAERPPTATHSLVFNILALCLAYAYVTRRLFRSPLSSLVTSDPDRAVAKDLLSQVVPFLTDKKTKFLFEGVESLVTDIWSRFEAVSDSPSPESFALLLADADRLFRPQHVTVINGGELHSHNSRMTLLAISDIAELYSSSKSKYVLHKLHFYAAYICGQSTEFLRGISDQVRVARLEMQAPSII